MNLARLVIRWLPLVVCVMAFAVALLLDAWHHWDGRVMLFIIALWAVLWLKWERPWKKGWK
jgi:hypothetical protein